MDSIVKAIYKKESDVLEISYLGKVFDTSRIKDVPIEQWIFPFYAKGVRWEGLYEELAAFTESEGFVLHFDSDDDSFELVKYALSETPVKLVGTNNEVTIVYNENPFTTKIMVNGEVFDTTLIQNRCIEEWINPIQIRDIRWDGIFRELTRFIGIDICTIYFIGQQKFMKLLIDQCPENMNIFYRDPQIARRAHNKKTLSGGLDTEKISAVAKKTITTIQQTVSTGENSVNTGNIPIKNSLIRNHIMTICAAMAIIFLFLPFAGFSAGAEAAGIKVESPKVIVSGFRAMFGIKEIVLGSNKSIIAFLLLIVPILLICMNYIGPLKSLRKWISLGASGVGIIAVIATLLDIRGRFKAFLAVGGVKLSTSLGIGFFLILLCYIATAVLGLIIYHGVELPKKKM